MTHATNVGRRGTLLESAGPVAQGNQVEQVVDDLLVGGSRCLADKDFRLIGLCNQIFSSVVFCRKKV